MSMTVIVPMVNADMREYPSLVAGAKPIIANVGENFVLLKDLSWSTMRRRVREFCNDLDQQMRGLFLSPAKEVGPSAATLRSSRSVEEEVRRNLDAPYILRIKGLREWDSGHKVPYFAFTYRERVDSAVEKICKKD
jgi:hypothetical protein